MEINFAISASRLIIGGIVCFLAILLMSKTRASEWMLIVTACLIQYFFEVITLFISLGFIPIQNVTIISWLHFIIPSILFCIAFIIKILKRKD